MAVTSPKLGDLEVCQLARELTLKRGKQTILRISLCEELPRQDRAPLLEVSESSFTCVWPRLATLRVEQRTAKHEHLHPFAMYDVTWTVMTKDLVPVDSIELGNAHWFGGAEMYEQRWPINEQHQTLMPFVTFVSEHNQGTCDQLRTHMITRFAPIRTSSTSTAAAAASWSASGSTRLEWEFTSTKRCHCTLPST